MGVILKENNSSKELCLFVYVFIVKVAPDLHARQCGGSKAHCSSAHLLPAQSFASNPNMTWEKNAFGKWQISRTQPYSSSPGTGINPWGQSIIVANENLCPRNIHQVEELRKGKPTA
jgi:hypothetical protein